MKTLPTEEKIRDVQKALIINMMGEDRKLVSWLKRILKIYGE